MPYLNVRLKRIENRWTQEYVAKKLGLTNRAVQLLETGQRKPSYEVLCKLEKLFEESHIHLLAQADNDEQKEPDGNQAHEK
jgi:transcriptional regulator with XRE-family HTH domain